MEKPNVPGEDEDGPPSQERLEAESALELIRQFQWGEIEIDGVLETKSIEESRFVTFSELQQSDGVHWYAAKDAIFSRNAFVRDTEKKSMVPHAAWDQFIQSYRKLIFNGHPHMAGLFEIRDCTVDRSGSGIRIINEWIEGESLALILQKNRKLPPAEIAKLSLQIVSALRFLHDRHCYHHRFDAADVFRDHTGKFVLIRYGETPPLETTNPPADADVRNFIKLILSVAHAQTAELTNAILQFKNSPASAAPARDLEAALKDCINQHSQKYLRSPNAILNIATRPITVFKGLFSNRKEKKN
ncbi:MAG: hypothetical protein ACKVS6_15485 [Planctomycetota bacterium]